MGGRHRDPRISVALSVLPGLGQLYNGQPRKALFYLMATLFTVAPAVLLIMFGEHAGASLLEGKAFAGFLLLALLSILVFLLVFVLGLYMWASAFVDARLSANELNNDVPGAANRWWFFHL